MQLATETVYVAYRRLKWTETDSGWVCGPLVVKQFDVGLPPKTTWGTFLDGRLICRSCGYSGAAEAKRAASQLGAVKRLM